jgi:hypothetical protein
MKIKAVRTSPTCSDHMNVLNDKPHQQPRIKDDKSAKQFTKTRTRLPAKQCL